MNIKKLREIAEAATPGVRYAGPHYGIYLKKHTDYLPGGNGITYSDVLCTVRPYGVDDQAFIATFNPETVLRLLDTIEKYEAALIKIKGRSLEDGSLRRCLTCVSVEIADETLRADAEGNKP